MLRDEIENKIQLRKKIKKIAIKCMRTNFDTKIQ
jgi:hypothetical protein